MNLWSAVGGAERAQQLARMIEGTTDRAVLLLDASGVITVCSRGVECMLGWPRPMLVGQTIDEFDPDGKIRPMLDDAADQPLRRFEDWRKRRDGSAFFAETSIVALRTNDDSPSGFGIAIADITARRNAEQALHQRELHLRSILATIPDAMIVIDHRGLIISFSSAAERLFGYCEQDLIGSNVSVLMPSPDREHHDEYIAHYEHTGERRIIGLGRIVSGLRSDGTSFPMELSVGEARDGDHRVFTGFIRDLTAQQIAERRMRELQAELIHVSRFSAMGTMAATLAHELNQPLTAIANYLEAGRDMLATAAGGDTIILLRDALDEAAQQALRAGQIVRRLREFVARGEAQRTIHDLPTMIGEATRLGLIGAGENGIRVISRLDPAAPRVLADRIQIQQVLVNLLRNAAEAVVDRPVRDIIIATRLRVAMIEVSVADTGTGIDPSVAPRLFEAFVSAKRDGMGLGLSICRTIIEAHGGRIWTEANQWGGATFKFTLCSADGDGSHD